MPENPREFRPQVYLRAALEHMGVAAELHDSRSFVWSHYVSGVAVECILRAYKAQMDANLDERHNLRSLAKNGAFLANASDRTRERLAPALGEIVARWDNAHRYRDSSALRKFLTGRRLFSKWGDLLEDSSRIIVNAAEELVTFGARKWEWPK